MNEYYRDLKPKDRINKIMMEYVEPTLKDYGCKYTPSNMCFKKKDGELTYVLELTSDHWNQTSVWCGFKATAIVIAHNYRKWHKKTYGGNVDYIVVTSTEDKDIPGYDLSDYMSGPTQVTIEENGHKGAPEIMNVVMGYNFSTNDNQEIINSFISNFEKAVLPYFSAITTYNDAIDAVMKNQNYFRTPFLMDMCEMIKDQSKGKEVYEWFQKKSEINNDFRQETLKQISARKERLDKGYNN